MDHRCWVRLPLRIAVEVVKGRRYLGRHVTRNMNVEGVFVEMCTTDLDTNDLVELTFVVREGEIREYSLMAGVVRRDGDGVGLMLFDRDHTALDVIEACTTALAQDAPAPVMDRTCPAFS